MKDSSIIVIGIAGGTGSGKTTITRKIMQHFGGNVSVEPSGAEMTPARMASCPSGRAI